MAFFEAGQVRCRECGAKVDVWRAALDYVGDIQGALAVPSLGASNTAFLFTLRRHQIREVDFAAHGVPRDAVILCVNYTPQAFGCFPLEVRGNAARAPLVGTKVSVFGLPLGDRADGDIPIAASVDWVYENDNSEPWIAIADALESLALGKHGHAILSAHAAIEIAGGLAPAG